MKQGGATQIGRERSRQPERDPHVHRYWGPVSGGTSGESTYNHTSTEVCRASQKRANVCCFLERLLLKSMSLLMRLYRPSCAHLIF